ncbi:MAG: peptide-methionine (S)-S-oxide reductase MsrA, partial [Arcobacteraceae bacterium]
MIVEIVFAAGCFWGVEKNFEQIPGVIEVKSGYVGGNYPNPTYKKVLEYRRDKPDGVVNYTEAVKVKFDNSKVTANELIKNFWQIHDPTQVNGQGNDIGDNYRSGVYYTNAIQHSAILQTKATYQTLLKEHGYGKIVTEIKPLEKFYDAENYHQDYLKNNPNGYCPDHSTGVKFSKADIVDKKQPLLPL